MKIVEEHLQEAKKLWKHLNKNQDEMPDVTARKFGLTMEQIKKLTILWAVNAEDSFLQAYEHIKEGT